MEIQNSYVRNINKRIKYLKKKKKNQKLKKREKLKKKRVKYSNTVNYIKLN